MQKTLQIVFFSPLLVNSIIIIAVPVVIVFDLGKTRLVD